MRDHIKEITAKLVPPRAARLVQHMQNNKCKPA